MAPLSLWMKVHRWLGLIAMVAVLCFGLSGLIHPIMSRTQPQPAERSAPILPPAGALVPLKTALNRAGIDAFSSARLFALVGQPVYRVGLAGEPARYFAASDASPLADGERVHAEALARHYTGDTASAVAALTRITAFDADYPAVNRLLPVWRVQLARADGLTAYVDTEGNRLATLNDDRKRALQSVFRALHTFNLFDGVPALRIALMLLLLGATFSTAVAGTVMYLRLKRADVRLKHQTARRWHRRLALAVVLTTFTFSLSGTWHLLQGERTLPPPTSIVPRFLTSELGEYAPTTGFSLLNAGERACYRLPVVQTTVVGSGQSGEHAHHHGAMPATAEPAPARCLDTGTGAELPDADRRAAEALARQFAGAAEGGVELSPVTRFGGEYGFINKRLPVWRARFAGSDDAWYVESDSGALALHTDTPARLEGLSFAYLHKWTFFGEDHKDLRDALLALFAFGNVVVAGLGTWVFFRRRRRPALAASPEMA